MDWLKKLENVKKFYQEPGFVLPEPGPTEQDDRIKLETYGWDFMAPKSAGPREGSTGSELVDAITERLVPDLGVSYKSPKGWSIGAGPWAGESDPSIGFQFRKEFDDGGRAKTLSKETVAKRRKSFFDKLPESKRKNQRKWEKANPTKNFYDLNVSTQDTIRVTGRTDLGTFSKKEKAKTGGEGARLKNLEQRSQIDNWLKNWLDNNFENYGVRDKDKFLKDLKQDWKKAQKTELKNNRLAQSGDLPGPSARFQSVGSGKNKRSVPNQKFFSMFNEALLQTSEVEKDRFYRRLFYGGQIDTNPELKKGLNDYFKTVLTDKSRKGGLTQSKIDELNKFLGKNSDVAFILGTDTGLENQMKRAVFGNRFKNYGAYREKVAKQSLQYMENIKKLEKITGIPIRKEIGKEQRALKKLLNVKELPLELRYSIDHLYGISEALRNPKDKAFAKQVARNLIGGTIRQNTVAGLEGYSVRRKMLINNINEGKNVTKSLARLNELTTEFYPQFKNIKQPYKIVDGKLTFAKGFKGTPTQEGRFTEYFKTIDKTKQGKELIRKEYGGLKNLLEQLCPNKAQGGRIGMKVAGTPTVACGANRFKQVFQNPAKGTQAERQLVGQIVKRGGTTAGRRLLYTLGPAGVGIDAMIEGAMWGDDVLKGSSGEQAWKNNWLSYLDPSAYTGGLKVSGDRYNETEIAKKYKGDTAKFYNLAHAIEDKYRLENKLRINEESDAEGYGVTLSPSQQLRLEAVNTIINNHGGEERVLGLIKEDSPLYNAAQISSEKFEEVGPGKQWDASWLSGTREPGTPGQRNREERRKREMDAYSTYDQFITPQQYQGMDLEEQTQVDPYVVPQATLEEQAGLKEFYKIPAAHDLSEYRYKDTGMSLLDEYNQRKKWEMLLNTKGMRGTQDTRYADGGIANVRRPHAIAPESGPAPQGEGLSYILNSVKEW